MKILYLVTKSEPFGGAQQYVYDLATHMKSEHDVVVAHGGSIQKGSGDILQKRLGEAGIRTVPIESLRRDVSMFKNTLSLLNPFAVIASVAHEIRVLLRLKRLLKEESPDILHVNSSKAGGIGAFACRFFARKTKCVFTVHGWGFLEDRREPMRSLLAFLSWVTVLLCDRTILISHNDQKKADWMPWVRHTFTLIHNGIDDIDFFPKDTARDKVSALADIPADKKSATWIGTISELTTNKGLPYAIRAMRRVIDKHPNTLFIIIGEGDKREELEHTIARLDLEGHAFLAGYVPKAARYLKALDIFTLTSIKEGHPYTILEAGQAGLPIVASDVGGIPDTIDDMHSGILVKPKKLDDIEQALLYLIEHPEKLKIFGKNIQKKVAKEFSLEKMSRATEALYSKL